VKVNIIYLGAGLQYSCCRLFRMLTFRGNSYRDEVVSISLYAFRAKANRNVRAMHITSTIKVC